MEFISLLLVTLISIFILLKYGIMGTMYVLIFLLPFRFEIFSVNGIGIRTTDLFALLYIIVWVLKLLYGHVKKNDMKIINKVLIFTVFVSFSFLINAMRFNSINNLIDYIRFLSAVATGVAISTTVKTKENIIRVLIVWTISASLSSIMSIAIFFLNGYGLSTILNLNNLSVVDFYEIKFSNSIFFEDPNNLATYLVISIFITIGLISTKHLSNKYKYLVFTVQSFGLLLTLSRSAYIAVGGALLIYMFLYLKSYKWIFLKLILTIIIIFEAKSFYDVIDSDISMMSRLGLWQVGINMTLSNPFIGVGIGNSSLFFGQYITSSLIIYNPHFHNLFLTISSEFGLVGLLLFVLIFIKQIVSFNKYNDKLYVFLVLGLIAYLIQSIGVEYFSSRHFWIFVPLLIKYRSLLTKGGNENGFSICTDTSL